MHHPWGCRTLSAFNSHVLGCKKLTAGQKLQKVENKKQKIHNSKMEDEQSTKGKESEIHRGDKAASLLEPIAQKKRSLILERSTEPVPIRILFEDVEYML